MSGRDDDAVWDVPQLAERQQQSGDPYLEFLRRDSLSAGLYVLCAGGTDGQGPHNEDELYFVIEGEATLVVGAERHVVRPGMAVFVEAGTVHQFEAIESDLKVLVFFAPAEGTGPKQ